MTFSVLIEPIGTLADAIVYADGARIGTLRCTRAQAAALALRLTGEIRRIHPPDQALDALAVRLADAAAPRFMTRAAALELCRNLIAGLRDGDCDESEIEDAIDRRVRMGLVVDGTAGECAAAIWAAWAAVCEGDGR